MLLKNTGETLRVLHSEKSKSIVLDYAVEVEGENFGVVQIGETRAIPVEGTIVDIEIGPDQYFPSIEKVKLKLALKWYPMIIFETHADGSITYAVSGADIVNQD